MQSINAQTIINQLQALAITAPDERDDHVTPTSTPLAYVKIKTSERGYAHIINDQKHLQAFADKVRKNAAAFGGGLIKTPKARPAITWPAGPVKLVAEMLEDGQQGEAAALAVRKCGALFFMVGSTPFMAWAPQAVEGLPECLASVRSTAAGNKWQVIHLETGRKLGFNCASRKAAEASALDAWANILSEEQRDPSACHDQRPQHRRRARRIPGGRRHHQHRRPAARGSTNAQSHQGHSAHPGASRARG